MMRYLAVCLLVVIVPNIHGDGHGGDDMLSPCMGVYPVNMKDCLDAIREVVQDNERFFFGTSYAELCPPERVLDFECITRFPFRNYSIATALFHPEMFDPDVIDRYLYVNFTSPAGSYTGCDYHYVQHEDISFGLDPTGDKTYTPWHVRMTPMVFWEEESDKQYTLIIQDVGYGYLHGVYMNIPGNHIDMATVIKEYHGPRNGKKEVNPYAFMLFEQTTKDIDLSSVWDGMWIGIFSNPFLTTFNVSDFRDSLQMKGPIAMNWILASFDAYAVEMQRMWGIENCAGLVAQEIMKSHSERPYFDEMTSLSVFARLEIHNEEISYMYCCSHYFWERSFFLDPIGNRMVNPAEARTGNKITVHMIANKMYADGSEFEGQYYTMLAVDPDVAFATAGTKERPLIHWLAINGQVENGMLEFESDYEYTSYLGPMPPDDLPHTYYFLIYHQEDMIDKLHPSNYTGDCTDRQMGRCLFDVNKFAEENDLTMVGASWFMAENDDYVNMKRRIPEEEACVDRECPKVAGGPSLHYMSVLTIVVAVIFCMLFLY